MHRNTELPHRIRLWLLPTLILAAGAAAAPPIPAGAIRHRVAFEALAPSRLLWVQAGAAPGGDGSARRPLDTIQAAADAARPGTAIMVKAGEYRETVHFGKEVSGTDRAPIWLLSADGPQRAHVIAPTEGKPAAIGGGGSENIIVEGFWITGGRNGIQFSQNGLQWTDPIRNILIRFNRIEGPRQDGIKVNGGDNVEVTDNIISGAANEGIDLFAITGGTISNNEIHHIVNRTAGIFTKGGSQDILIAANYVHDIAADGIDVGGWSNADIPLRPGHDSYEARDVTVIGNRIERVGKRPISFLAAIDSRATGNFLQAADHYYTVVHVGRNWPKAPVAVGSRNILVTGNIITRGEKQLFVSPESSGVTFTGNRVAAAWPGGRAGADLAAFRLPAQTAGARRN